jgi:hypothetical protein
MPPDAFPFQWVRPLAAPYLRGYRPKLERETGLRGYSFRIHRRKGKGTFGFFVGFLLEPDHHAFMKPSPPECLIFAFVDPVGSALHRSQVLDEKGALRWTFGYIRWLTHRPPRFEFHENELAALVRHFSMREWPKEKYKHFAGNFFTETLAWLVRSGVVRRWRELAEK